MNSSQKIQIADISMYELELSQIFQEQYNDLYSKILHISQDEFISNLQKQVSIMIKINRKKFSESLIKKVLNIFTKMYLNDKIQCQNFLNILKKVKPEKLPFLEKRNYYIHCQSCKEAFHSCGNALVYFNNIVFCIVCEEVYKSCQIKMYCCEHNINYYSKIRKVEKNNLENLFPVSFLKLHCERSKEFLIKCQICHNQLYTDVSLNNNYITKLICECCKKIIDVSKLTYCCDICNKNFKCEAKIHIDFDKNKLKSICIIHSLIKQNYSIPKIIMNKECNCDISKMIKFKHYDGGILFDGNYNGKKVIVCSECFGIFNYDNFEWICPICNTKFNTKEMRLSKSSYKQKNSLRSLGELSRKRKERDNSGGNNIKRTSTNLSLSHLYKKSINEDIKKNNNNNLIYHQDENNINNDNQVMKRSTEINFRNYCSPSETKKMHNILFEFMNIKNGKNSFRYNNKPKLSMNNNSGAKLNLNNFSDTQRLNKSNKFIGKYAKNNYPLKIDLSTKLEEKEIIKTEINEMKLNTNSEGHNSDSTNLGSIEEKNNLKHVSIYTEPNKNYKRNEFDSDDYNIIKLIGEGTFGKIYLVEHPITHLQYAMKKISASSMNELKEKKKEYELLINLYNENPTLNVVKILGIQSKKLDKLTYVMYVLMELANIDWEKEIRQRSKKKIYYSEKELILILINLIETFSYLQGKGVSHRDVKPQNILCFNNNIYKIADFGEAKTKEKKRFELLKNGFIENEDYNNDTNKQTVRGTELYMSPILFKAYRQYPLENAEYNAFKNDVFSLGYCILFAATLTYQSLYDIREICDQESERIIIEKYLRERYSQKFINLVMIMLQIKEKKRPDFVELNSWIKNNYLY